MTLKDKFQQWFINDEEDEHYEGMAEAVSIEHEKIADEFAIGFGEWFDYLDEDYCKNYTIKELKEIYKKEKGL
jgi:hypothetical protein